MHHWSSDVLLVDTQVSGMVGGGVVLDGMVGGGMVGGGVVGGGVVGGGAIGGGVVGVEQTQWPGGQWGSSWLQLVVHHPSVAT